MSIDDWTERRDFFGGVSVVVEVGMVVLFVVVEVELDRSVRRCLGGGCAVRWE